MKLVLLLAFSLWLALPTGAQTAADNEFSRLLQNTIFATTRNW